MSGEGLLPNRPATLAATPRFAASGGEVPAGAIARAGGVPPRRTPSQAPATCGAADPVGPGRGGAVHYFDAGPGVDAGRFFPDPRLND